VAKPTNSAIALNTDNVSMTYSMLHAMHIVSAHVTACLAIPIASLNKLLGTLLEGNNVYEAKTRKTIDSRHC
jgi:hypothetical protein